MDFDRLKYFSIVAQTKSITKASKLLNISPAALSKSVRILEEEVGFRLLRPEGRGISITNKGVQLAERAQELIQKIYLLPQEVNEGESTNQTLRVGSFEVFTTYFLGNVVEKIKTQRPLELREMIPGQIENGLIKKQIDIGITYIPVHHNEIEHIEVANVKMGVFGIKKFMSDKYPLSELPFATPLLPIDQVPSRTQGLDGWRTEYGRRKEAYKVDLMESALELCRQGVAVSYLPKFVVELHNRSQKSPFVLHEVYKVKKSKNPQSVYICKRVDEPESPEFRQIARELRSLL